MNQLMQELDQTYMDLKEEEPVVAGIQANLMTLKHAMQTAEKSLDVKLTNLKV